MSRGFFRRENEIERMLRDARPHASGELADRLAARADATRPRAPRRLAGRVALAGGFTAVLVGALAATGGIGYAATTVSDVIASVTTHHAAFMGARMAVAVKSSSAAADQYTTVTGTSANVVAASSGDLAGSLTVTRSAAPGATDVETFTTTDPTSHAKTVLTVTATGGATADTGTVSFAATTTTPGSGGTGATTKTATITMSSASLATVLSRAAGLSGGGSVLVDPAPQVGAIDGQPVVGVTFEVHDSSGKAVQIQNLPDPISISVPGPYPADYVPAFSTDGVTFTAVPKLTGTTLPNDKNPDGSYKVQTGYYIDSNGQVVILSRHATLFAAVTRAGLGVSESGRKLKKAGSGLFGDALLVHPGPATVKEVGKAVSVYPFKRLNGRAVKFSFFVDEQVSAYVQLYKGSKRLPLQLHGTQIRGGTITKAATIKTLHIAVLKPGTLPIRLRVPRSQLQAGAKYRIRVSVIDYDGNKTVSFIPFTG